MGSVNRHPVDTAKGSTRVSPSLSLDNYNCYRRQIVHSQCPTEDYFANDRGARDIVYNNESTNARGFCMRNVRNNYQTHNHDALNVEFSDDEFHATCDGYIHVETKNAQRNAKTPVHERRKKQYVPWSTEANLELDFAVACKIDDCDCSDRARDRLTDRDVMRERLTDTVSLNTSNNTFTDIGSRIRDPNCWDNDSSQFVADHFAEEAKAALTDESDEVPEPDEENNDTHEDGDGHGHGEKDLADVTNSFELLEWEGDNQSVQDATKVVDDTDNTSPKEIEAEISQTNDRVHTTVDPSSIETQAVANEGFCTAPSSPGSMTHDYYVVDNNYDVSNDQTTTGSYHAEKNIDGSAETDKLTNAQRCEDSNTVNISTETNTNEVCQSIDPVVTLGDATECEESAEIACHIENNEQRNTNNYYYAPANSQSWVRNSRILVLDTPPFIPVKSINYEGDPVSGEAEVVGRGSFGIVYKARFSDPMFAHLPVVVKEFDEEFSNAKEIIQEAQRLFYLQDTGYVPVCYGLLCYGPVNHQKFGIVQELVGTGLTLEQMLWDRYELPITFWFEIALQSCDGLAAFHDKGILLNDIKTNNIILELGRKSLRIRYIDFGLATDMRGKRYKNTKSLEDFLYLAPEVRVHGGITTIASDVFSLGFMIQQIKKYSGLYELSTVAGLCMDVDPTMRIPVRGASSLIRDQMIGLRLA